MIFDGRGMGGRRKLKINLERDVRLLHDDDGFIFHEEWGVWHTTKATLCAAPPVFYLIRRCFYHFTLLLLPTTRPNGQIVPALWFEGSQKRGGFTHFWCLWQGKFHWSLGFLVMGSFKFTSGPDLWSEVELLMT
jgi:hypothetical protein